MDEEMLSMSLRVYCSSSSYLHEDYLEAARAMGRMIAE